MATTFAWLKQGPDGRLYAINPENGFFGVAPGTNAEVQPNALASTKKGTIFTNVVLNKDDNTVWWEGLDKNPPENALDWETPGTAKSLLKRALIRTTASRSGKELPVHQPEFDNPKGVPISAMIFGGRRAKTAPLVYQSLTGPTVYS